MNKSGSGSAKGVIRNRSRTFFKLRDAFHASVGDNESVIIESMILSFLLLLYYLYYFFFEVDSHGPGKNDEYVDANLLAKRTALDNSIPRWMAQIGDIKINMQTIEGKSIYNFFSFSFSC